MDKRKDIIEQMPHLMRYARALTRDAAAADDLVQDCVSRALSRLHLFKAGTNMRAWLFTILHNIHVQNMRTLGRRPRAVSLDRELEERRGAGPTQDAPLMARDLQRALDRLPDEQREVVLLVGLEEMTYAEAAEVTGVPVGTIMSRLARGRERLRRMMAEGVPTLRSVK